MRLKITLKNDEITLPINYQIALQGVIYNIFSNCAYGDFLHNVGYRNGKRVFKNFTFSNLIGKYKIENKMIKFTGNIFFFISGYSEEFIEKVYEFLTMNSIINLNGKCLEIEKVEITNLKYFKGTQTVRIRTLSPVVCYQTTGRYVTYYKPSDPIFNQFCVANLNEKMMALKIEREPNFEILEVLKENKRMVIFKNTFYEAYLTEMIVMTDYPTLSLIFDTGLSSKGSAGFGMVEIVR